MEANNVPRHNTNNNVHANGPRGGQVQISALVWGLMVRVAEMIFRMYLTVVVVLYQWTVQLLSKAVVPLQPAIDQVRKVPRQDVSPQGIFYQYMRFVFLVLLYVSPWAVRGAAYVLEPLRRARDWAVDYVEGPWRGTGKQQRTDKDG